jgi:recombinational DNA repair ATPase RecF
MAEVSDIVAWMRTRIESDPKVTDEAGLLVLAALEGEDALNDMAGYTPPTPRPVNEPVDFPEPAGAFLKQITARGFRGIGPTATLTLQPGPGLTVVAGRNGSGKSSFAEALEMALTQTTYRWRDRSTVWQEAWRNIHHSETTEIDVTIVEETVGETVIALRWDEDADWRDTHVTLQRKGEKRQAGIDGLGWAGPLETYRPMMSYDELGAILGAEPSKLHDALSKVLGLEQVSAAIGLLGARLKELSAPASLLMRARTEAKAALEQVEDPRKVEATRLLRSTTPDTAALRVLVSGAGDQDSGVAGALRRVLGIALPTIDDVDAAATALSDAVGRLASAGDAAATGLELRAALLRDALELHRHGGDQICPVCSEGRLTTDWAARTRETLDADNVELADLRAAQSSLHAARERALGLLAPSPPALIATPVEGIEQEWTSAQSAWTLWVVAPASDLALADHLAEHRLAVGDALDALQRKADEKLAEVEDAWVPVAARLGAVLAAAEDAAKAAPRRDQADAAHRWLKNNEVTLKNVRLEPIAQQAATIWAQLRQESNVEIAGMRLEGTATRRHVKIETSVDGSEAAGMAVLSQGELHALALALFLPRASMPESPFRFVVLDDPVQAMDPSKVDGLVSVLGEIAKTRQVVVFSHDDRLAAAVRRSHIDAHILEVTRGAQSWVSVRETKDPASRYLDDARAIVSDENLPDETRRRVLPGLLRLAAEAQARDRYFSDRLSKGEPSATTEAAWSDAHQTAKRIALAIYGDTRPLDGWLQKEPARKRGLGVCTSAIHTGLTTDVDLAVEDVSKMVADLREGVK